MKLSRPMCGFLFLLSWLVAGDSFAQDGGASASKLQLRCTGAQCQNYETDPGEPAGRKLLEECVRGDGYCNYYADGKQDHRIRIGSFPEDRVGARLYGDTLAFSVSCGSPCNTTTFVDLQTGFVSDPFDLVLAFDRDTRQVAFDDGGIKIASMYDRGSWCDVKRDFSSKAQAFISVYRRDFDRHGNFTFEYLKGEPGEITTDVAPCKSTGKQVDVYAVVVQETKDPMFVHIDVGSERDRPLRKAGVRRPFPVVQRAYSRDGEVYRLVAGICSREEDADALATTLAKDFPSIRIQPLSLAQRLVHRGTCPRLRKP